MKTKENITNEANVVRQIDPSYSQLFDVDLIASAYQEIKSKPGNMAPGADGVTLDGISRSWAESTIEALKDRSYKCKPVRRVFIPKANGKLRPLGIPCPRDKVVQLAFKRILESVFEPIFKDTSHGFRPGRSPHTALYEVRKWSGTTWMIEGDIKGFFDNLDHHKLADLLKTKIKDKNLIDLYWKMARAGYVSEGGGVTRNNLGVPQGGIISPLLSNIYLHEFDKFMEGLCNRYTDQNKRVSRHNPEYAKVKRAGDKEALKYIPSMIRDETTGYRVRYNRYADDWVIGVSAPRHIVVKIVDEVEHFLKETLSLELSREKTKITHLEQEKALYLGVEIGRRPRSYTESLVSTTKTGITRRGSNTRIVLYAPMSRIVERLVDHGFAWSSSKPKALTKWVYLEPADIIARYNAVIRGLLNYYKFVENRNLFTHVTWILKFSAALTLAIKWNISPAKVFKRLGTNLTVTIPPAGKKGKPRKISFASPDTLKRDRSFKVDNYQSWDPFVVKYYSVRSNFIWDNPCIICGSKEKVEMHHVKHIKKVKVSRKWWNSWIESRCRSVGPATLKYITDNMTGRP